jgi:hypothetical protein
MGAARESTLFVLCGDHPIHAGTLKRMKEPYNVALILWKSRSDSLEEFKLTIGLNAATG